MSKLEKVYLPSHKDGGNRGCEAITKGTARILGMTPDDIVCFSGDVSLDTELGLSSYCKLISLKKWEEYSKIGKIKYKFKELLKKRGYREIYRKGRHYEPYLKNITTNDIALSTGGDMFCYDNNEVIYINDYLTHKGVKTILWGCSIGKENLSKEKIDTLHKFSAIITRETLTKELLDDMNFSNVKCYPDPAFVLKPELIELPECFRKGMDVIGINLSNFVGKDVGFSSIIGRNIVMLINHILQDTDKNILLIPHVFWEWQDDRIICQKIYEKYKGSGRVFILNSEKLNYTQIRYVISKCRYFMGARTHAMISAYATLVPAVALGYSIKSHGIAKDIGLPDELVVDCNSLTNDKAYTEAYKYLIVHEQEIRQIYDGMDEYIKRAYGAREVIE
jgi:colanic acid/amylovoran biosynthesis protein